MFDVANETGRLGKLTEKIIGSAIAAHRVLGPGLLESAYEECVCYELVSSVSVLKDR